MTASPHHPDPGQRDPAPDDDDLTATERKEEPPELDAEDEAEQAAVDSFPASDPPSLTPSRAGSANPRPVTKPGDEAK